MRARPFPLSLSVLVALGGPASAQAPATLPPPLTERQAEEVVAAIAAMKASDRGPYLRIRWFCADSTIQPPQGTPCAERGGGVQHAEYNDRTKRLARLQFHVGTILQATPIDSLYDAASDHHRLKELVLARYLFETDDGWVLRRARFYRGARQIEDEERRGKELLEWLLGQPAWTARNYLLAAQLVGTVPHAALGGEETTHRVRNLATEIADLEPRYQRLRLKIHSFPSREDVDTVEARLAQTSLRPEVRTKLTDLRDLLRLQYDAGRAVETIARYERRLRSSLGPDLAALRRSYADESPRQRLERLALLAANIRDRVTASRDGRANLVLMDLGASLQEQAFVLAQELAAADTTRVPRAERLRRLGTWHALAYGAGFLSARERDALRQAADRLLGDTAATALDYRHALGYQGRALDWGWSTARSVFGPVHQRYLRVEPKAAGFLDALVRGSVLLPLSTELGRLAADADGLLAASHEILGQRTSHGARGLNPGVARGRLAIVSDHADHTAVTFDPDKLYVLPAAMAELKPVAGVLTMEEGNLLSHVQLLARNLGIPNASFSPVAMLRLQEWEGRELFYAVSPLGRVILKPADSLNAVERGLLTGGAEAATSRVALDVSRLRLDVTTPIPLSELRAEHSGVTVGPKAANLGQLAAYFPGRVSAGLALPFGMFYQHVDRPVGAGPSVLQRLEDASRRAQAMRAEGRPETEVDQFMFGELAEVRRAILELEWLPETRRAIEAGLREVFGASVSQGIFVRSDTNVEDLPQFSGAGLNLTVPHQVTVEDVLAGVKRVWTSPFSERAYLWRKQILEAQARIYPSVLLLQSVHSEKSGVLITTGLQGGTASDLTIATAEGVGGAVEGEDAEQVLVGPTGEVTLLSQAKSPQRRMLPRRGGGAVMVAASRPERLLAEPEIAQLRDVVAEWKTRFAAAAPGTVWDIEFGFVGGRLWLFQIRPFVRFRSGELLERLHVLDAEALRNGDRRVLLAEGV